MPDQYDSPTPATPSTTPIFGKTEAAVYDPVQGVYLIQGPSGPYTITGFKPGDIPAPADYLGNGLGSGGRLPARHRSVHRGDPGRAR